MPAVDELDIKISASANDAVKSLDNVIRKIKGLEDVLNSGIKGNGIEKQAQAFKSFAETVKTFSDSIGSSMKGISSSIDPQVSQITKTFTRLANAGDKSTQVSNSLPKIGNTLNKLATDMSKIGNIDSNINKFVSSIARLANAGDKSAIAAKELPRLGDALKRITENMKNVDGISDSTNSFAQTIAQLANSGDKAGKAASGLSELSQRTLDFFNAMKEAPQISENTIRMTQAMAQLSATGGKVSASMKPVNSAFSTLSKTASAMAKTIKNALKTLASILSGTFSKIGQIGIKTANSMKKVAGDMVAAFSRITHSSKGLNSVSINLGNILKAIVGFKGIQGLMNFGKSALEFGSDITEVENVVDVAFGSMRKHAYDFASAATQQFGLSELAAKQYSGTMMAMLKSSGVMQSEAAKMSTTIAGLAGDIASFYNIDTDEAFYKLRSAISGETEPMKALGVNMNVVNLEAFALSRGITKAYKDMTLAEQATLRYNYILAKTTDAQGDFARTADTYANQIRLLKLNIQSLSGVLGQGLIAGILPAIKALNMLMAKLMQTAQVFRNFMYTLVGKKLQGSMSGIVNDLAGIGDASESLNNLGDAAEEAGNKLKKKLFTLPFDELNVLSEDSDSLSDALGDIGNIDIGMEGFDDLLDTDVDTPINIWAKRIRDAFLAQDWEGLGSTIAELLNKGLQKIYDVINWNNVGDKITKFVDAFTRTFNSLVDDFDWDLLGRTVGAGINTLVNTFNQLIEKIDFKNLGTKLSVGLRGMIGEVDWQNLGNLLGNYFMIAWRMLDGFISDMARKGAAGLTGFQELGIAVADAVQGIFEKIDFGNIGQTIANLFNGIFETIQSFADKMSDSGTWKAIAENISNGLNNAIKGIKPIEAAQALGKFVTDLLQTMLDVAQSTPWDELGRKIGQFLVNIPWSKMFWQVFDIITTVLGGLFGGLVTEISSHSKEIGTAIADWINTAFEKIKNLADAVPWSKLAKDVSAGLNNMIHGIKWKKNGQALNDLMTNFLDMLLDAAKEIHWEELGRGIGDFLSEIEWEKHLKTVAKILMDALGGLLEGFGDTPAGKIVISIGKALLAIKLTSHLMPFVNNIVKFFTGESVGQKIAQAFGSLFEKGIKDGASSVKMSGLKELFGAGAAVAIIFEGQKKSSTPDGAKDLISTMEKLNKLDFKDFGLSDVNNALLEFGYATMGLSTTNKAKLTILEDSLKESLPKEEDYESLSEFNKAMQEWKNTAVDEAVKKHFQIPGVQYDESGFNKGLVELKDKLVGFWDNEVIPGWNKGIGKWWNESVTPYFTKDKWSNTYDSFSSTFGEKLGELKKKLTNTGFDDWIKDSVKPFFEKDKWSSTYDNFNSTFGEKWGELKKKQEKNTFGDWIKDSVKPFFEKDKWSSTYDNFSSTFGEKLAELKQKQSSTGFGEWIENKVNPFFQKEKWAKTYEPIKSSLDENLEGAKRTAGEKIPGIIGVISNKFSDLPQKLNDSGKKAIDSLGKGMESQKGTITEKAKQVANTMDKELTGLNFEKIGSGMMNSLAEGISKSKNALKKAVSVIDDTMSSVVSNIESAMKNVSSAMGSIGKSKTSSWNSYSYSVPMYAAGGFPEDGLFFANHNELVGQFTNGQTAVANNAQIVDGIKYGVREAVAEVLAPYLADIAKNTRETADKDTSVRIGDRDIVDSYNRGTNRMGYSFQ